MKTLAREDINAIVAQQVVIDLRTLVKELLDNALDSGATVVYLRVCGTESLQVTDNGRGIPPSDFSKLAVRGATSKLETFEGLKSLVSKGFRGEALFSIAQTCKLEVTTRTADDRLATRLTYWDGQLQSTQTSSADTGTTVKVTDLFSNLPVRRKDMTANAKTQLSKAVQLVQAYVLMEDTVRITFASESGNSCQILVEGMPSESLRVRAARLYGNELQNALMDVNCALGDRARLSGVVLNPAQLHKSMPRDMQLFYINKRHVFTPTAFKSALKNVFRNFTVRSPIYALHLEIPPEQVDINFTPDKMEVRVIQEKALAGKLYTELEQIFKAAVDAQVLPVLKRKPEFSPFTGSDKRPKLTSPTQPRPLVDSLVHLTVTPAKKSAVTTPAKNTTQTTLPAAQKDKLNFLQQSFGLLQVIGQFNTGFIITILQHTLFIIDQHAADEKATFESLMKTTEIHTQPLMVPQVLRLPVDEHLLVTQHLQTLANIGFRIQVTPELTGQTFKLLTKPLSKMTVFETSDLYEAVANLKTVQFLTDQQQLTALIRPKKFRDMFASRACRGSVMIGTDLRMSKMQEIVRNLATLEKPWNCPHGRPTIRHLWDLQPGAPRPLRPVNFTKLL